MLTLSGDGEIRTLDPLLARQVLSQLSYTPTNRFLFLILLSGLNLFKPMGLSGLEPPTSRLSGVRSNRLSYKPSFYKSGSHLLSHAVSSIVPSAVWGLTIVFGMGTGVTPTRIATGNLPGFLIVASSSLTLACRFAAPSREVSRCAFALTSAFAFCSASLSAQCKPS